MRKTKTMRSQLSTLEVNMLGDGSSKCQAPLDTEKPTVKVGVHYKDMESSVTRALPPATPAAAR